MISLIILMVSTKPITMIILSKTTSVYFHKLLLCMRLVSLYHSFFSSVDCSAVCWGVSVKNSPSYWLVVWATFLTVGWLTIQLECFFLHRYLLIFPWTRFDLVLNLSYPGPSNLLRKTLIKWSKCRNFLCS